MDQTKKKQKNKTKKWMREGRGGVKETAVNHKRASLSRGSSGSCRSSVFDSSLVCVSGSFCERFGSSSWPHEHRQRIEYTDPQTHNTIHSAWGPTARPTPHSPKRAACGAPLH